MHDLLDGALHHNLSSLQSSIKLARQMRMQMHSLVYRQDFCLRRRRRREGCEGLNITHYLISTYVNRRLYDLSMITGYREACM